MLQRALASLLCLLGASSIGLGIASATVWRASDTLVASAETKQGSTLLLTEPGVLDMAAETVSVVATSASDDKVVLALGRTADVEAWVGEDPRTVVTGLVDRETLSVEGGGTAETAGEPTPAATEPAATDPAVTDPAAADPAAAVPDPAGSDLWVAEASGAGQATLEWTREDGRWSVLAANVGPEPGPLTLTLTWPQEVTTPWLVPGVVAGSVLLLAGLVWWTLLLVRQRRAARWTRLDTSSPTGPLPVAAPPVVGRPVAPGTIRTGTSGLTGLGGGTASAPGPGSPPVGVPVDVISGPMTRRQLRDRERLAATGAIPQVPAAQRPPAQMPEQKPEQKPEQEPTGSQPTRLRPVAGTGPSGAEPGAPAPSEPPSTGSPLSRWGRRLTELAPRHTPAPGGAEAAGPGEGTTAAPGGKTAAPGGAKTASPGGAGAATPGGAQMPAPAGPEARTSAASAPSADLWRRAWGFPSETASDLPAATSPGAEEKARPGGGTTPPPPTGRTDGTETKDGDQR